MAWLRIASAKKQVDQANRVGFRLFAGVGDRLSLFSCGQTS
jgi:hypothetical protein